ncbi:lysophospholipid acyltransferase family protein [Dyadobacter bucti]|uniref:lysophospholipid acyltransferase family protein n=1 Tax=Dyadobacter bucti TaxID=2572203 RepID=UPI001108EB8E|nr:lysophospholipid acyltransferase family protein [Dyadobacter bucti]
MNTVQPVTGAAVTLARWLSHLIFLVFAHIWPYRKKIIRKNLEACFPELSDGDIKSLSLRYYRHISDLIVETLLLANLENDDLRKLVSYENSSLIHQLINQKKDIVLIASHYGNWEYLFQLPLVADCTVLAAYSPVSNGYIDKKLKSIRSRFGIKLVPKSEWYRTALNRRGDEPTIFITIADQRPPKAAKQAVNFFGRTTYIQQGAARIAVRRNCAVVYADVEKDGRNKYKFTFRLITSNAVLSDENAIMKSYYEALETTIRRQPEWWLWSHNRWKFGYQPSCPVHKPENVV